MLKSKSSCKLLINKLLLLWLRFAPEVPINVTKTVRVFVAFDQLSGQFGRPVIDNMEMCGFSHSLFATTLAIIAFFSLLFTLMMTQTLGSHTCL